MFVYIIVCFSIVFDPISLLISYWICDTRTRFASFLFSLTRLVSASLFCVGIRSRQHVEKLQTFTNMLRYVFQSFSSVMVGHGWSWASVVSQSQPTPAKASQSQPTPTKASQSQPKPATPAPETWTDIRRELILQTNVNRPSPLPFLFGFTKPARASQGQQKPSKVCQWEVNGKSMTSQWQASKHTQHTLSQLIQPTCRANDPDPIAQ